MKKSLFNKYESYTPKGGELYNELQEIIDPIIKRWADEGYLMKDIESIAIDMITMSSAIERARRAMKLRKEERKVEEETEDFAGCGPFIT